MSSDEIDLITIRSFIPFQCRLIKLVRIATQKLLSQHTNKKKNEDNAKTFVNVKLSISISCIGNFDVKNSSSQFIIEMS